jgi:hypothetical protein
MTLEIEVRSSGPGPRRAEGWGPYPATHRPLSAGRVLAYWIRAIAVLWPRDGVAAVIRRAS